MIGLMMKQMVRRVDRETSPIPDTLKKAIAHMPQNSKLVMLQPKRTPNNIVQGIRFAMIPVIGAGIGYGTYKLRQHWNKVQPYYNKFTNGVTNATNWMFHKIGNITSNILNRNSNDVNITRSHE